MAPQPLRSVTAEEYLAGERESATKHEYFNGEIVAMAGASFAHALIVRNVTRLLAEQLKDGKCSEFGLDLRVSVASSAVICYPDITVACPPYEFLPGSSDTLTNPAFLIEVCPVSTRSTDRACKLPFYRQIPSLQGYLFVEQDHISVEYGCRVSASEWSVELSTALPGLLQISGIGCSLPVARIYTDVPMAA